MCHGTACVHKNETEPADHTCRLTPPSSPPLGSSARGAAGLCAPRLPPTPHLWSPKLSPWEPGYSRLPELQPNHCVQPRLPPLVAGWPRSAGYPRQEASPRTAHEIGPRPRSVLTLKGKALPPFPFKSHPIELKVSLQRRLHGLLVQAAIAAHAAEEAEAGASDGDGDALEPGERPPAAERARRGRFPRGV